MTAASPVRLTEKNLWSALFPRWKNDCLFYRSAGAAPQIAVMPFGGSGEPPFDWRFACSLARFCWTADSRALSMSLSRKVLEHLESKPLDG